MKEEPPGNEDLRKQLGAPYASLSQPDKTDDICGKGSHHRMQQGRDRTKSSDSLETLIAHSCKSGDTGDSTGDSMETEALSAGSKTPVQTSSSLQAAVAANASIAAASSVAAAAEALATAAEVLVAAAESKEPLQDLGGPQEALAVAQEAVAAVLARPDVYSPSQIVRDHYLQELSYHRTTLANLNKVRQQCIRLEAIAIAGA